MKVIPTLQLRKLRLREVKKLNKVMQPGDGWLGTDFSLPDSQVCSLHHTMFLQTHLSPTVTLV